MGQAVLIRIVVRFSLIEVLLRKAFLLFAGPLWILPTDFTLTAAPGTTKAAMRRFHRLPPLARRVLRGWCKTPSIPSRLIASRMDPASDRDKLL